MIDNFSAFYYNFDIGNGNKNISFSEGAGELIATIQVGSFTASELAQRIKIALDLAGTNVYTVAFDRQNRSFAISSGSPFSLLVSTGTAGASAYGFLGFTGPDRTGFSTYSGGVSGDFYLPQFKLQDFISQDDYQKLVDPSINESADGRVEVVRFGISKFIQMNIKYATDKASDGKVIRNNPTGVDDLRRFMQFLFLKKPLEFMPSVLDLATFTKIRLESTDFDGKGTGFKLKELYDKNLAGYFETGILVFRTLE
jgi:hypothetical protein